MLLENKVAVVVIAYNNPDFIKWHESCLYEFMDDDYDLVIVDNSHDYEKSQAIKYHSKKHIYIKTDSSSIGGSESHAFAANVSWAKLKDNYRYFLYLDHDCFLVKHISLIDELSKKGIAIGGIGQEKSKTYLWPGCLMIDKFQTGDIDFSVSHEFKLDTGGNIYKTLDKLNPDQIQHFNEAYTQNPDFVDPPYNFYTSIYNGTFMHFINGSNWNKTEDNERRINSLFNILQNKIDESSSISLP